MSGRVRGIAAACSAAALFGVTTPIAKSLLEQATPLTLATLLYLGAGAGVLLYRLATGASGGAPHGAERKIVAAAIMAGGVLAPTLQLVGLAHMPAASAALLLNAESAFTVLLARWWFREHIGRGLAIGMALVVAGAAVLSFPGSVEVSLSWAPVAVLGACLAWAIDNNLTRQAQDVDPTWLAAAKGVGAGATNLLLCLVIGASWPSLRVALAALLLGALGYGASLILFIRALRALGAARTSGYFALAPFVGAAAALLFGGSSPRWLWLGGGLMAVGVLLHLTEHHEHPHQHQHGGASEEHAHAHFPDTDHRHDH